jgi:DNA modification methylase
MNNKNEKRANYLSGRDWKRYSISVWNDIRKTKDEARLKHPAMFPKMLVERLIECFTTDKSEKFWAQNRVIFFIYFQKDS